MDETFQRLFTRADPQVLSLNVQAARGPVHVPERSQFSLLVRHFLERFFNHETASPDGDAKTRLVQIAFAIGLPGFVVATYLWPLYHPFPGWPPGSDGSPPTYWLQVNHHFFFVLYSFVAMGIVTVFEWDLFFPDLLDIFILGSLPVEEMRVFLSRVAAIFVFIAGFLFDVNIIATLILVLAMDPPSLSRFLIGHMVAVAGSGLFAAAFILALQGVLLSVLGEQMFRKLSLAIQGLSITVLLMLMLVFPVLSGVVPVLLQSGSAYARCLPPFWFLGIYQRLLDGPSALPIYTTLAQTGCWATLAVVAVAILTYPLAYVRRVKRLVEGAATRLTRSRIAQPFNHLLHATAVRPPVRRAVFHFINQTLFRVPRYRVYLVLYGGAGLSVVAASVLRLAVIHRQVHLEISADGIRAALGVIPFWVIVGLRMAFVSAGNQRGNWVYRIVHGKPPYFEAAMEQLLAAKVWVVIGVAIVTGGACLMLQTIAPAENRTGHAVAAAMLIAAGMCVLLTDILFMNVNIVAFTGAAREQSNLAFTVLKFFTFFPIVAWIPGALEPWIESSVLHFAEAAAAIMLAHLLMRFHYRRVVKEHSSQLELEDDEEDFPMRLGLRY